MLSSEERVDQSSCNDTSDILLCIILFKNTHDAFNTVRASEEELDYGKKILHMD